MTRKQVAWVIVAMVAGIGLAVMAFRARYGNGVTVGGVTTKGGGTTPAAALPRYTVFGETYDPYAIWPYGPTSNYQLFLASNSGVPTTELPSFSNRLPNTAPANALYAGSGNPNGLLGGRFGGNGRGRS